MPKKKEIEPIDKEIARLSALFEDIAPEKKSVCEGLIVQAARLRVMLDKAWEDIQAKGDTELFSQSPSTEPYERERPVAHLFNARDKAYQTIIKTLVDMLPDGAKPGASDELMKFALSGIQKR
jgi:hypothetical protein